MPSEKMRYIRRRMDAGQTTRTDIKMTPLKEDIESVFNPCNIDEDCRRIAGLLDPYKDCIRDLLNRREFAEAFSIFYEILESLSYHFVKDEHYCHFDDMYSPDYVCYDILKDIVGKIKDGIVIEADVKYLSGAMDKIERMESYESYGTPFVVSEWCRFLTQCEVNT